MGHFKRSHTSIHWSLSSVLLYSCCFGISYILCCIGSFWIIQSSSTTAQGFRGADAGFASSCAARKITEEELKAYDGSDPQKPLRMAIKGQIYDVSQSMMFYGPGGPYALFAGEDASRSLAKMSFEDEDLTGDISGLGPIEIEALQDWEYKFMSKYVKVGSIQISVPATEAAPTTTTTSGEAAEATDCDVAKPVEDAPTAATVEETLSGVKETHIGEKE